MIPVATNHGCLLCAMPLSPDHPSAQQCVGNSGSSESGGFSLGCVWWMPTESGNLGPPPRAPGASPAWRGGELGVHQGGGSACRRTGPSTQPSPEDSQPLSLAGPQAPHLCTQLPATPTLAGRLPCLDLGPPSPWLSLMLKEQMWITEVRGGDGGQLSPEPSGKTFEGWQVQDQVGMPL